MFSAESTSPFAAPVEAISPATQTDYPFRLLRDETVLGTFPVARQHRPLGKLASYLFVTDSRVIYAAEAKTVASSSTHLKEYQVPTVTGVEVARHRGLGPLAGAAALGAVVNFILLLGIMSLVNAGNSHYSSYSSTPTPGDVFGVVFGVLAAASLVVGAVVVAVLARPTASISIVGPGDVHGLARGRDLASIIVVALLFVIFGPFIGVAVLVWTILRELGMFKADDAQLFADSNNIDRISYEVGALILDVQARGKLAGKD